MSMSQEQQILAYLQTGATVTRIDAIKICNCYCLPQRVLDLRRRGYSIISEMVKNKDNNGKHAVYSLGDICK